MSLANTGALTTPNPLGNSFSRTKFSINSTCAFTLGTNALNLAYNFLLASSEMFLAIPPILMSDGWIPSPAIMSTAYCAVFLISLTLSTAALKSSTLSAGIKSGATRKWWIA